MKIFGKSYPIKYLHLEYMEKLIQPNNKKMTQLKMGKKFE